MCYIFWLTERPCSSVQSVIDTLISYRCTMKGWSSCVVSIAIIAKQNQLVLFILLIYQYDIYLHIVAYLKKCSRYIYIHGEPQFNSFNYPGMSINVQEVYFYSDQTVCCIDGCFLTIFGIMHNIIKLVIYLFGELLCNCNRQVSY